MDDPYKLPLPTIPHKTMAVHGTPRSALLPPPTPDATDFISDGDAKGLKVNDVVIYVKTTATVGATLHSVGSVTAGGAATLTPAILA